MKTLLAFAIGILAFSGTMSAMGASAPWLSTEQLIFFSALVGLLGFLLITVSPDFLAQSAPSAVAAHQHRRGAVIQHSAMAKRTALTMPKPAGAVVSILWGAIKVEIPMAAAVMA